LLHGQLGDRGELASSEVEQRAGGEQRQSFEGAVRTHGLQAGAHPVQAFTAKAAQVPWMPQARDQSRPHQRVAVRAEGPLQGRAEVVVLGVQPREPRCGPGTQQVRLGLLSERQVVPGVPLAQRGHGPAVEAFPAVLPGGLEHAVPALTVRAVLELEGAAGHQAAEQRRGVGIGQVR
jgi:hypothetical protein